MVVVKKGFIAKTFKFDDVSKNMKRIHSSCYLALIIFKRQLTKTICQSRVMLPKTTSLLILQYASFGKASLKACLLSYSLSEVSRGVSVVWPRRIPVIGRLFCPQIKWKNWFKLKRVVHEYETIFQLSHCPFSNASIHLHKVATLNKITTVGKFCSTPTNWTTANLVARFGVKHQIGLAKTRSNSKPLFYLRFFELLLCSVFCCKT
ncbi:hypothetical protein T05_10416 [Trichinella murrelli]|uniref:Uncharacterized protein n=1 Tax=Trichinella murrelli TaxID=144512 RepID=A0A0V0U8K2_9BILA|nr:hypothetical protein T05_10416 [Trichinella murrelli]